MAEIHSGDSPRAIRIGSLFSGIGGLELGLEVAGLGPVAWQVEQDPFCRRVLENHWPQAERFEDVRTFRPPSKPELLCGGFPCQDVSSAGTRQGLEGKKSGLWSEFARTIREVGPRYVVIENVSALKSRGLDVVLGDLAESGYDAIWDCIPAQAIGAPHERDRLFLVAWHVRNAHGATIRKQRRGSPCGSASPFARFVGEVLAYSDGRRQEGLGLEGSEYKPRHEPDGRNGEIWPPYGNDLQAWGRVPALSQPSICRMADGLPRGLLRNRRARLKALGNAVVPPIGYVIGRFVVEMEKYASD